jgi:archaeal type IV pilus assembly protein PilA
MNNYKRFIKNTKAISPIFATLILIAIAVIAGVVVYMFTSGFLATSTTNTNTPQEKVAVQGVDVTVPEVLAQNMGSVDVIITAAIVKDANGNVISTDGTGGTLTPSAIGHIPFDASKLTTGLSYTVTLVSSKGGSFVSPAFMAP